MEWRISLGDYVRDCVTELEGTVTGRVEYLTGCNQCLVQPSVKEDGTFRDSYWLDESRLDLVAGATRLALPVRAPAAAAGSDREPPHR